MRPEFEHTHTHTLTGKLTPSMLSSQLTSSQWVNYRSCSRTNVCEEENQFCLLSASLSTSRFMVLILVGLCRPSWKLRTSSSSFSGTHPAPVGCRSCIQTKENSKLVLGSRVTCSAVDTRPSPLYLAAAARGRRSEEQKWQKLEVHYDEESLEGGER